MKSIQKARDIFIVLLLGGIMGLYIIHNYNQTTQFKSIPPFCISKNASFGSNAVVEKIYDNGLTIGYSTLVAKYKGDEVCIDTPIYYIKPNGEHITHLSFGELVFSLSVVIFMEGVLGYILWDWRREYVE